MPKDKKVLPVAAYKKGDVTIEGQNFNDEWARNLKTREIDGVEYSAKQLFVREFDHSYPNLSEADRKELLEKAYDACIAAE